MTALGGNGLTLKGAIHNIGTIAVQQGATLTIDPTSGVTLDGGGKISLDDNPYNYIYGAGSVLATLTNIDNTISGSGQFLDVAIVNKAGGTINASGASSALIINSNDTLQNAGLVEATGTAGLSISGIVVSNLGGTISAATGSAVYLSSDLIDNGLLQTIGTGVIHINDSGTTLSAANVNLGLTLSGKIEVDAGQALAITGSVVNNGTILLDGAATLNLGATLNGSGSIVMADNASTTITSGFNNVGNTISGAGRILAAIQQQSGGTIEATDSDTALVLNTGATIQNDGALEANGALLTVDDAVTGAGHALVTNGGALRFLDAFNENVTFSGTTGSSLELTDAFGGTISGFGVGDTIQLLGANADTAALNSSDDLIVSLAGVQVASLQLSGAYATAGFLTEANANGVEIIEVAAATVAQYLANIPTYDVMPNGFIIADTAAQIQTGLTKLALELAPDGN